MAAGTASPIRSIAQIFPGFWYCFLYISMTVVIVTAFRNIMYNYSSGLYPLTCLYSNASSGEVKELVSELSMITTKIEQLECCFFKVLPPIWRRFLYFIRFSLSRYVKKTFWKQRMDNWKVDVTSFFFSSLINLLEFCGWIEFF